MSFVLSLVGFVLIIGILVTIHEWGHYQVARWFNIKVVTFSIGFGKPIWKRQGRETEFQVGLIPLGGYVKFVDESEGEVAQADLPRAFNRQSVYRRFAVVAAGPLVNLIFAWLVFSATYMIGVSGLKPIFNQPIANTALAEVLPKNEQAWLITAVDEQPVSTWLNVREMILKSLVNNQNSVSLTLEAVEGGTEKRILQNVSLASLDLDNASQNWLQTLGFQPVDISMPAVIGNLSAQSPAGLARLQQGDLIVGINQTEVQDWQDLVTSVRELPDESIIIHVVRNGQHMTLAATLSHKLSPEGIKQGYLGVGVRVSPEHLAKYTTTVRHGPFESLKLGLDKSEDLVMMTYSMLKKMLFGEVGLQNLSGPVSIAQFSGQALETGLIAFLGLLGLLSLSLGLLNLLPIPVLDGGHLVYYIIEMFKGSPVSESVMLVGQKVGLILILGLTILALTNDILRITNG